MAAALDVAGNPSSVHAEGRRRAADRGRAREQVAALVGAEPRNVIFTSRRHRGQCAGADAAISSTAQDSRGAATGSMSADRASFGARGRALSGRADRGRSGDRRRRRRPRRAGERLASARRAHERRRWSRVMLANNETGVIQPVAEAAASVHAAGGAAACRRRAGAGQDLRSTSARSAPIFCAFGAQDRRPAGRRRADPGATRRCSREPLLMRRRAGARRARRHRECRRHRRLWRCAAAAAGELCRQDGRLAALRDELERALAAMRAETRDLRRREAARLPNTTLFAVPGIKAETARDRVRSRRASRSRRVPPARRARSRRAMCWRRWACRAELARGAIRVSLGRTTTTARLDVFLKAWTKRLASTI